jgi:hypothetical protein
MAADGQAHSTTSQPQLIMFAISPLDTRSSTPRAWSSSDTRPAANSRYGRHLDGRVMGRETAPHCPSPVW